MSLQLHLCLVRNLDCEAFFLLNRLSPRPMWSHSNSCFPAEKYGAGAVKINALVQIAGLNERCDTAMIAA